VAPVELKVKLVVEAATTVACGSMVGTGGGVPSTVVCGCPLVMSKDVAPVKSPVVHGYVPSAPAAVASNVTLNVPPGQRTAPGCSSGGERSIVERSSKSIEAFHAAAGQPPPEIDAPKVRRFTKNPDGIVISPLSALSSELPEVCSVIV